MQTENTCTHCGARLRKYKVSLSRGIINTLIKFRQAVIAKDENKIHLLEDMQGRDYQLTRHEWNNFSRLRFHGLVAKYKENGQHVSGYWLLTKRGADFLNGKITIPHSVEVFRNRVVSHSEHKVNIRDAVIDIAVPYFEDRSTIEYAPIDIEFDEDGQGRIL